MKELEALHQLLEQTPFEKRGTLYQKILHFSKEIQIDFRTWRHQRFQTFIAQKLPLTELSLVLDVDEEDALYELWGINLHTSNFDTYLPIHWLKSNWEDINQNPFGNEIQNWCAACQKHHFPISQDFWIHLQELVVLIWEDLSYWNTHPIIYTKMPDT